MYLLPAAVVIVLSANVSIVGCIVVTGFEVVTPNLKDASYNALFPSYFHVKAMERLYTPQ